MHRSKAQSAVEFLMTYGWAILIIAVVLGALFRLGVFSSSSLSGTSCVPTSGYLCQNPIFNIEGNLSFTFGNGLGKPIYNVALACAGSATPSGLPNPSPPSGAPYAAMVYIYANGMTSPIVSNSATSGFLGMVAGQEVSISGLSCYGASGSDLQNVPVGTSFSGGLWVNYTLINGAPSGGNPLLTAKFATVSAKAS